MDGGMVVAVPLTPEEEKALAAAAAELGLRPIGLIRAALRAIARGELDPEDLPVVVPGEGEEPRWVRIDRETVETIRGFCRPRGYTVSGLVRRVTKAVASGRLRLAWVLDGGTPCGDGAAQGQGGEGASRPSSSSGSSGA